MAKIWRQGDVIIRPLIREIKEELKPKGDLVLAEGEVTGHAHRITQGKVELQVNALLGLMILRVLSDEAVLSHEEHADIILLMGDYEIKQQREYDWMTENLRRVAD